MPIHGITDRPVEDALHLGYPKIATLFKGDPKPDQRRPGKDRETFRIEFQPSYRTPEMLAAWRKLYCPDNQDPVKLDWVFLFGFTPEQVFPTWMEEWTKTVMVHRCDGQTQVRHYERTTGKYSDAKIPCACIGKEKTSCQRVGRLNLWLPLLMRETGVKGYISIATHSLNDLVRIDSTVKALFREYGDISSIPLQFGREPEAISTPMNGERATTTKSLLYLRVMPDFVRREIEGQVSSGALALPTTPKHLALAAPQATTPPPPPEPTTPISVWTPETIDRAKTWVQRNFGLPADMVIKRMNRPFDEFTSTNEWMNAVKAFLLETEYPILARAIEVGGNAQGINGFNLITTLGAIKVEGGATVFERLFGDERDVLFDRYDLPGWASGGQYDLVPPAWVSWTKRGDELVVTGLSFNQPALPYLTSQEDDSVDGVLVEEDSDGQNN